MRTKILSAVFLLLLTAVSCKKQANQGQNPAPAKPFNQMPNGVQLISPQPLNKIILEKVWLTAPGFAVLYESNKEDQPGKIIKPSPPIPEGEQPYYEFPAALKEGPNYWLVLYKDNGDGIFNAGSDKPITEENSNYLIAVKFQASKNSTAGLK